MFRQNKIDIKSEDLMPLFEIANQTRSKELNFDEFKNCAFDFNYKSTVSY